MEETGLFAVELACNGHEVLERIHAHEPELLVLDPALPGTDGIRVLQDEQRDEMIALDGVADVTLYRSRENVEGFYYRNTGFSGKLYGVEAVANSTGIPRCTCGGIIKPDVVLYEESLDEQVMDKALDYIAHADVLIIGGTSLVVYPAAGLVQYFRGRHLVVVNKGQTGSGVGADLTIDGPIGEIFAQL